MSLVTGVDTKGRRGRGTKAKKADEASTHGSHPLSAVMLLLMQREPERDDRGREREYAVFMTMIDLGGKRKENHLLAKQSHTRNGSTISGGDSAFRLEEFSFVCMVVVRGCTTCSEID